ncbi:hypothetical protein GW17_00028382, partial [Ensete ventricosum]
LAKGDWELVGNVLGIHQKITKRLVESLLEATGKIVGIILHNLGGTARVQILGLYSTVVPPNPGGDTARTPRSQVLEFLAPTFEAIWGL